MDSFDYSNIEEIINQLSDQERLNIAEVLQGEFRDIGIDIADHGLSLNAEQERLITDKVIRTIHRQDFGAELIRLSTAGFMETFLALINPVFAQSTTYNK